jgi:spore germination protein
VTYIVQAGDYLGKIALHYGTTVDAIRALNNLHPSDPIFPGQVLYIPAHGIVHPPIYVPRQTVNGYYHVRAGDTMFAIAHSFNVNIYDIAEANGILNLNSIFAGQALRIPGY